jgi:hypothetical protein
MDKILIATVMVGLFAVSAAHASLIPSGSTLSIQSYGPGLSPFSNQYVTSAYYSQPGYSSGYFSDSVAGIRYGGFASPSSSGSFYSSNYGSYGYNSYSLRTSNFRSTISQYSYPSTSGYQTRYAGYVNYGPGYMSGYNYYQPTVWGNSYGRPTTYGYDMLGSSGYRYY